MIEIRNCPICGLSARATWRASDDFGDGAAYQVTCPDGCMGAIDESATPELAATFWNRLCDMALRGIDVGQCSEARTVASMATGFAALKAEEEEEDLTAAEIREQWEYDRKIFQRARVVLGTRPYETTEDAAKRLATELNAHKDVSKQIRAELKTPEGFDVVAHARLVRCTGETAKKDRDGYHRLWSKLADERRDICEAIGKPIKERIEPGEIPRRVRELAEARDKWAKLAYDVGEALRAPATSLLDVARARMKTIDDLRKGAEEDGKRAQAIREALATVEGCETLVRARDVVDMIDKLRATIRDTGAALELPPGKPLVGHAQEVNASYNRAIRDRDRLENEVGVLPERCAQLESDRNRLVSQLGAVRQAVELYDGEGEGEVLSLEEIVEKLAAEWFDCNDLRELLDPRVGETIEAAAKRLHGRHREFCDRLHNALHVAHGTDLIHAAKVVYKRMKAAEGKPFESAGGVMVKGWQEALEMGWGVDHDDAHDPEWAYTEAAFLRCEE